MAGTERPLIVADAGPIIHLDELASLDLLNDFETVLIPGLVWREVVYHRPQVAPQDIPHCVIRESLDSPSARLRALANALALDAGEIAAIALAEDQRASLLLCDDAAARLAAESLGFTVRGTLGILIRSIRSSMRSRDQVIDVLRHLPERSSLHVSRKLLDKLIEGIDSE